MTHARFLAGIALDPASTDRLRAAARELGFVTCIDHPGLVVSVAPGTNILPLGDDGAVIGTLFSPAMRHAVEAFSPSATTTIVQSAGRHLVHAYWGGYLAILRLGPRTILVRPPFGDLPCLLVRMAEGVIAGSDVDLLRAAGARSLSVDYEAVARQLATGDLRQATTCLTGIEELRGGDCLNVEARAIERTALWSPWTFVTSEWRIDDPREAERRLRDAAINCVALRTHHLQRPLLLLSGGLDSSVVAACLAANRRDFACLNAATVNPIGDERDFARMVAERIERPLVERLMDGGITGIGQLAATRLPRPVARSFEQRVYQLATEVADSLGCDGLVDGGGGDNVFGSIQSASPAADCLLDPAGRAQFRRLCGDIGALAEASRWRVAWRAFRRSREAARPFRWPTDRRYLHPDAPADMAEAVRHPWLDKPGSALPGRAAHIAMLVAVQAYIEDGPHGTKQAAVSPLVSQPLIEHCLRIPSWEWFAAGHNRAAARRAFQRDLPHDVVWRRGKGTPDGLIVALVESNRGWIRDHLAGGLLARAGVLNVQMILNDLDDRGPARGTTSGRMLQLADAESWARGIMAQHDPHPNAPP